MNPTQLALTDELAADIRAHVKTFDFKAVEKLRKSKEDNGTFDVIISTEDLDRSGEIVRQNGWEMTNYKNNPIVLWGHDYYSLPVGVCLETYLTEKNGVPALGAKGVFLSAEINPFAQQVRKLYEFGLKQGEGVGCTTSVGFIPKEFDESNQRVITRAELLEFSFVPIPAQAGVGPAAGRSLTFSEAKLAGLDLAGLTVKGITFAEDEPEEKTVKEAQAGDACDTDDGSPGVLTTDPKDPDGALVCLPQDEDKTVKDVREPQKKILKAVSDEHARHDDEVEKALDEYREKSQVVEGQSDQADADGKKAKRDSKADPMREHLKDLRSALADEHIMHRAKSLAVFRSFEPEDKKDFERNTYLKALRGEHDAYETKCNKSLDEFEEKCTKSVQGEPGSSDENTDWITGKLDANRRTHKKAVTKIAKAMVKDAFGEEDQADEKTLEILKQFLAPHIDPQLLPAVAAKVGARISAATKERLSEAHQHMKAATAIVEALHGGLGNDDGEESRSDDEKSSAPAPAKKRSRPTESPVQVELNEFLSGREIVREITTVAQRGLAELNKRAKL